MRATQDVFSRARILRSLILMRLSPNCPATSLSIRRSGYRIEKQFRLLMRKEFLPEKPVEGRLKV